MKYIYPVLSTHDFSLFRIGGPGLANCMFFVARAVILAKKLKAPLLRPTWERFGIGQWIRGEREKRTYAGIFKKNGGGLLGIRKVFLIATSRKIKEEFAELPGNGIVMVSGLRGYFSDLWSNRELVCKYFSENVVRSAIATLPDKLSDSVAIHVRLGDYPQSLRTNMEWYLKAVQLAQRAWRMVGRDGESHTLSFKVFSDGSNEELSELLAIPGVERVGYGNAFADMLAISKCKLLIGSDSTFSGWGAFLGNVPCVFAHLHYGRPLEDGSKVLVAKDLEGCHSWMEHVLS